MPSNIAYRGARAAACVRRPKALELRIGGQTYDAIGKALGVSGKTAFKDVQKSLAELAVQERGLAEQQRQLDLARIDKGIAGLSDAYDRGDPKAVMAMARLIELRSRLLGTLAPARVLHGGDPDAPPIAVADLTQEQRADRLRELIAVTRSRQTSPPLLTYNGNSQHIADGAGGVSDDT